MEDLNKHQIILLTLLVSFVTSIATGIITVSLLQQAPLEVNRNINRIVEKTIETVTPATITLPGTKEVTTVVVKEDDLVVSSVSKNAHSIVRIKEKDTTLGTVSVYGIGLVISKDGLIATDRQTITAGNQYTGMLEGDIEVALTPVGVDKKTDSLLFKAELPEKTKYEFVPATFSAEEPKLGQTVIALGGDSTNAVSVGRVISLASKDSGTGSTTVKYIASIETDVPSKDLLSGSPLFNLSGDVVGMKLSLDGSKVFIPILLLKKEFSTLTATSTPQ